MHSVEIPVRMNRSLRVGPFQPDLEDGFCEAIAALRGRVPLDSIYVLVPTHVLGRHLLRTVAHRHGVCFNIRFHTFPDLAEIIGIEALVATKRLPLPVLADFLIVRKAINAKVGSSGYFAPIRESPGTARAVLASLTDIKKAGIGPADLLAFASATGSGKLRELAAVYEEVERLRREAGYFDWSERLIIAAREARSSRLLDRSLALCLYGFSELNHLEAEFAAACLERCSGYAFVPEDIAGHTDPLIRWFRDQGFVHVPTLNGRPALGPRALAREVFRAGPRNRATACDLTILSAPGATQEIEEVARQILEYIARPGASFSDVGVLLRHPPAYERTIRDVFDAAGIPFVFLEGIPLHDTLAGRLIRLLIRIRRANYPRADVMEFLGLAPLRPSLLKAFPQASPVDWDRYSREAGIVGGRENWGRLGSMRGRLEWRLDRLRRETAEGLDTPGLKALEHDLHSIGVFQYVINVLLKRLAAIPDRGAIGALMGALLRALRSVAALPEGDRAAIQALADIVRDDVADDEITFDAFATLAEDLLTERLPATDVYRSGRVVVSSLSAAAGMPFKLVLIPGLVERSFPQPARQDPVLLDREREALGARYARPFKSSPQRAAEERFVFRHAAGAAEERLVLSYPRLDAATGQVRVASHYLLRVAEALTGRPADYALLDTLVERIPISRLAAQDAPYVPAEWDIAAVVRALNADDARPLAGLPGFGAVTRGTRAEGGRWGQRALTEYDGVLGVQVPLPATMAATQLETYGTCPFRYFGDRVLGIREVDEPEAVETISPLDRGALLHDILEELFAGLVKDGLVPVRAACLDECRARLLSIADRNFGKFERSGAVGYPFMWAVEKARILTDLEGLLALELARAEDLVPRYFEARFGPTPAWAAAPPGSMPRPLELMVGGRPLHFTGYIDRIDVGADDARVLDYKTGAVYGEKADSFRGAQSLQLPLYILAADAMLAHQGVSARTREAVYYYATGRARYKRVAFTRAALDARFSEFLTILDTIATGIAQGMFPQHPGDRGENCKWCAFKPVCGQGRVTLAERKAGDPRLSALHAMWSIQ
jgi:ATP-dependent helicase/nuclease subunit B